MATRHHVTQRLPAQARYRTLIAFVRATLVLGVVLSSRTVVAQQVDTTGSTSVFGTVTDTGGHPLPNTAIGGVVLTSVPPTGAVLSDTLARFAATAGPDGRYHVDALPRGAVVLLFRRVGYAPRTDTLLLDPGTRWRLDVTLAPAPPTLAPVNVQAQTDKYHRRVNGLFRRFTAGKGIFITRAQIDSLNTAFTTDLFRQKPGIFVLPGPGGSGVLYIPPKLKGEEPPCEGIHYCVNGIEWPVASMQDGLDSWSPDEIETIEIYRYDYETPPEFLDPGPNCGAVAIWTRERGSGKQRKQPDKRPERERGNPKNDSKPTSHIDSP